MFKYSINSLTIPRSSNEKSNLLFNLSGNVVRLIYIYIIIYFFIVIFILVQKYNVISV